MPLKAQPNLLQPLEPRRLLSTFTVTTNADANPTGPGTLRAALLNANANPGPDTIAFNLPAGQRRITISSDLPAITGQVTIDGATQPGYAGSPIIEIVGQTNYAGLTFGAGSSDGIVRGLAIGAFPVGITIDTVSRVIIQGNYIGLDASAAAIPNLHGIQINGFSNRIGGTSPGQGNVISGNLGDGVRLIGPLDEYYNNDNFVEGNLIGTDPTGAFAVPNDVGVRSTIMAATIGGSVAAARNIISGNRSYGVWQEDSRSSGSALVMGNYIGTDITGAKAVPNNVGVHMSGYDCQLGGYGADALYNVISGNLSHGVVLDGNLMSLYRNLIGADASGQSPLPNGGNGITVKSGKAYIGFTGTAPTIAFNQGAGIVVESTATIGATISGTSIYANGGLGIDLGNDGVTLNDPADADTGANSLQNFPALTAAARIFFNNSTQLNITGELRTIAQTQYIIQLFASPAADPSGYGEGTRYLGQVTTTTNSSGVATFNAFVATDIPAGWVISATATKNSASGDSSEFSLAIPVTDNVAPVSTAAPAFAYATGPAKIVFKFSEDVFASLDAGDLHLTPLTPGQQAAAIPPYTIAYDALTNTASFIFSSPLPSSEFHATLSAAGVNDPSGNHPSADLSLDFWNLAGDFDRDRKVGFSDLVAIAQNYNTIGGATLLKGDANGDGSVDFWDLVIVAQNYDTALPTAAPAPAAPIASARAQPLAKHSPIPPKQRPVTRPKPPTPIPRFSNARIAQAVTESLRPSRPSAR